MKLYNTMARAVFCSLFSLYNLAAQPSPTFENNDFLFGPPQACPIWIAHQLYDGQESSVARNASNVDCIFYKLDWEGIDKTRSSDDQYATLSIPKIRRADCIRLDHFGLNIPPGAIINGVEFIFEGHQEGSTMYTTLVQMVGPNGNLVGKNRAGDNRKEDWPKSTPGNDDTWSYGFYNDTWGLNLTSDFLNDDDFGIQIQLRKPLSGDTSIARLDQVQVKVYYSPLYTICHDSCTVFYVDPVPSAFQYHWDIPKNSWIISRDPNHNVINLNVMSMNYGIHEICVETESASGLSDPCCMNFRLTECKKGSAGDFIWRDNNRNGIQDLGENGIGDLEVELYHALSHDRIDATVTNDDGYYYFGEVLEGSYYVRVKAPNSFIPTSFWNGNFDKDSDLNGAFGENTTRSFYVDSGEDVDHIDIGYIVPGSIGDYVWYDDNLNGIQDVNEQGVSNYHVILFDSMGTSLDSTVTDSLGYYCFKNLNPDKYQIQFEYIKGHVFTLKNIGIDSLDSDADNTGLTDLIVLDFGMDRLDIDAGIYRPSSVKGKAWFDRGMEGIRDAIDPCVPNILVAICALDSSVLQSTLTDSFGQYRFDSLQSGNYLIKFSIDSFHLFTKQNFGPDSTDSDVNSSGMSKEFNLAKGDTICIDAGFYFDCQVEAGGLTSKDPSSGCYDGQPIDLSADLDGNQNYPSPFIQQFLLIDIDNEIILEISDNPQFSVDRSGHFAILSVVLNPDVNDLNYFNLGRVTIGSTKLEELIFWLEESQVCFDFDFVGVHYIIPDCVNINGTVWYDRNKDGLRDVDEPLVEDVVVNLRSDIGTILSTTESDDQGFYDFGSWIPGNYEVQFQIAVDHLFSPQDIGSNDAIDSDVDVGGLSDMFTLTSGEIATVDAGHYFDCQISLGKLELSNPLKCFDGAAMLIMTQEVIPTSAPIGYEILYLLTTGPDHIIVASSNVPVFSLPRAGIYQVHILVYTPQLNDFNYLNVSPFVNGTTEIRELKTAIAEQQVCAAIDDNGLEIRVEECARIEGLVWLDKNQNGIRENNERLKSTQEVLLFNENGMAVARDVTDAFGGYEFTSLSSGNYSVGVELSIASVVSLKDQGGNDSIDNDFNSDGNTDVFIISSGQTLKFDLGYYEECEAYAGTLMAINGSPPCWSGQMIKLESTISTPPFIPSNNTIRYLLLDKNETILQIETRPEFLVNTFGEFMMRSFVFDPNATSVNYFDITRIQPGITSLDELQSDINSEYLCADISDPSYFEIIGCGNVEGTIWYDSNEDGLRQTDEPLLDDIELKLCDQFGMPFMTAFTSNGKYVFPDIMAGNYIVKATIDSNRVWTAEDVGNDETIDSDFDFTGSTGVFGLPPMTTVTLDAGQHFNCNVNAGTLEPVDPSAECYEGQSIELRVNQIGMVNTPPGYALNYLLLDDGSGKILQRSLTPSFEINSAGQFAIVALVTNIEIDDEEYFDLTRVEFDATTLDELRSMLSSDALCSDIEETNFYFDIAECGSISGLVWLDEDQNGMRSTSEGGVEDMEVSLCDATGSVVDSRQTEMDGSYLFDGLSIGDYRVKVVQITRYLFSPKGAGVDPTKDSDVDSTGVGDLLNLTSGLDITVDAGVYEDCNVVAAEIGDLTMSKTCLDGDTILLKAKMLTTPTVPIGFGSKYLLSKGGVIVAMRDSAQFEISDSGLYCIHPIVFDNRTNSGDYIDIDVLIDNFLTVEMLKDQIILNELCADFDDAGICIEVIECGSIGNFVWYDENTDGIQDANEVGLNGVPVTLYDESNMALAYDTTANYGNGPGEYSFDHLMPGKYYLIFESKLDTVFTLFRAGSNRDLDSDVSDVNGPGSTDTIIIVAGQKENGIDAGYIHKDALLGVIGDYVWIDRDNDGIQDRFEIGLNDITVDLYSATDQLLESTISKRHPISGTNGYYVFDSLVSGEYYLMFRIPIDYEFAKSFEGFDDDRDSDISNVRGYGSTNILSVSSRTIMMGVDVGIVKIGSIGDRIWVDENADGIQDDHEEGMNDITVNLFDVNGDLVSSTVTKDDVSGDSGYYVFEEIVPNGYYLQFEIPADYKFTVSNAGGDDTKDSDVNESNGPGTTSIVNISPGEHDRDADAGIYKGARLGNFVWLDDNANGRQDVGEEGMGDIKVRLYDPQNRLVTEAETNSFGTYDLGYVPIGEYFLEFEAPNGFIYTRANNTDDKMDSDVDGMNGYGTTDFFAMHPGDVALHVDAGLIQSSVLAVDIISFEAKLEDNRVNLSWEIGEETNVLDYKIERRKQGHSEFEVIQTVPSFTGNSFSKAFYEKQDLLETEGVYLYRLRITEASGEENFSRIRTIKFNKSKFEFKLSPVPASDQLTVELLDFQDAGYELIFIDLVGKQIYTTQSQTVAGQRKVWHIDLSQWAVGQYIVQLKKNKAVINQKRLAIIR